MENSEFLKRRMKMDLVIFEGDYYDEHYDNSAYQQFVNFCNLLGLTEKINEWSEESDFKYNRGLYLEVVEMYLDSLDENQLSQEHFSLCQKFYN